MKPPLIVSEMTFNSHW